MQTQTSEILRALHESQRIIATTSIFDKLHFRAKRVQRAAAIELQARLDAIEIDETTLILDTNERKAS